MRREYKTALLRFRSPSANSSCGFAVSNACATPVMTFVFVKSYRKRRHLCSEEIRNVAPCSATLSFGL